VALELKRSAPLVSAVLARFPDAARYPDPSGRLPLHAAIEASAPLAVLQALAEAYPRALNMPVSSAFEHKNIAYFFLVMYCEEREKGKITRHKRSGFGLIIHHMHVAFISFWLVICQVHSVVAPAGSKPPQKKLVPDEDGKDGNDDSNDNDDDEPAPALMAVTNAAVAQNAAAAAALRHAAAAHPAPNASSSGEGPWDTSGTAVRQEGAVAGTGGGGSGGGRGSKDSAPGTRPQSPSPGGASASTNKSKDPDRCLHLALR